MRIQRFEKGFSYSAQEVPLIEKKLSKLATYCERIKNPESLIRIETEKRNTKKDSDQVKVSVTVDLPKAQFRAESRRVWALEAIDRCMEKLKPQIDWYKEEHSMKRRERRKKKLVLADQE